MVPDDPVAREDLGTLPREALVGRARALRTVLQVAEAVATAGTVEQLAGRFVDAVVQLTRYPSVVLFAYDPRAEVFDALASRGFDLSHYPATSQHLPLKGSLTGLAAARREIVTTADVPGDARVEPETQRRLAADGFTTAASVPVVHQGELIGAFNLIYPAGPTMDPSERTLLLALARTIGVAMAHRRATDAQRRLEEQARRAQQLESLGLLAGGIAHDFNNLLVGILGNVDVARELAAEEGQVETAEILDEARKAAERARSLVRQLLTFSRAGAPVKERTGALAELVRDAATFAVRGTSILCAVEVAGDLGLVEVDAGQIAQVIQNLVLNAAQASASGATVTVRLERLALAEAFPPLPAGPIVRVQVVDRGRGIAPEHLDRIFDPFFTLRPGGTGLGLAVTHSIVDRHGGRLEVSSAVGRGTTITIDLPAETAAPAPEPGASIPRSGLGGPALLMDDDAVVRRVARRMLQRLGFEVTEAANGAEALAAAGAANAPAFRVALLDRTVVGGLGGAEIAGDLRRLQPGMRLVTSSGYAHDAEADAPGSRVTWDGTLAKPYTAEQLAEVLAEVLASS